LKNLGRSLNDMIRDDKENSDEEDEEENDDVGVKMKMKEEEYVTGEEDRC
jgi:hypothetical protein